MGARRYVMGPFHLGGEPVRSFNLAMVSVNLKSPSFWPEEKQQ